MITETISTAERLTDSDSASLADMQQAPIRNASTIGVSVYSHSGEFAPVHIDMRLPGRGLNFQFIRSYRSALADQVGELGRGWSSNIAQRIEREGHDILYHNGAGNVHKFVRDANDQYTSPAGFYGVLLEKNEHFVIHLRHGQSNHFEAPKQGGRLLRTVDRNHNVIQFSHSDNNIVISDTLGRQIVVSLNNGLLKELKDSARRSWKYNYDENDCLIEVIQPATADFPNGTSVKYGYDSNHRLTSIADAKDQNYLVNSYDPSGKVITQKHGNGNYTMEYLEIDGLDNISSTYRTTCINKNGGRLVLDHNQLGNVLLRTLYVRRESFAPEDLVGISGEEIPLMTKSSYNNNCELTSRTFPAGNKTEWLYDENENNPRSQGNLLQTTIIPSSCVESDQRQLVARFEYESDFQLTAKRVDPRGNETTYEYDNTGNLIVATYPCVTIQPVNGASPRPNPLRKIQKSKYQYNSRGQLLRATQIDGSVNEYHYYPSDDPTGQSGPDSASNNPNTICGYLARIVRDANGKRVTNEYAYDDFGNVATTWDGKRNPARVRYNAMGKIESITSRAPFRNTVDYSYDANYNEIDSTQSFERLEYDQTSQTTMLKSSTLREQKEFNVLDNITRRKIVGDDKIIAESFIRDADERVIRQIQPLGNTTEYVYDERNLVIEQTFGVGTTEGFSNLFTYALNGSIRTVADGNGNETSHHYDGFQRYKGYRNAAGTGKRQWFDAAGNVVRVKIEDGDSLAMTGSKDDQGRVPLMEMRYHFDEWNRAYRVDKAWHDAVTGEKLGRSKWDGEKGVVSTLLEYAENGLLGRVWTESDNVLAFEYDGVGRIATMQDLTGDQVFFEYDENNNLTLTEHLGPEVEGGRFKLVLQRKYDEMDRVGSLQENDEAPQRFAYNALGNVIKYVAKSGLEIQHTDDSLGRRVGHVFTIQDPWNDTDAQKIVRRFDYDDNYRLTGYTNSAGKRTKYHYDVINRQTQADFPDGNAAHAEYDANGNIVREVDQNNTEIKSRYDAVNRLVERRSLMKDTDEEVIEQFEYDRANRVVAATSPDAVIRRTYDSLSRLLTEQQGEYQVPRAYDSAGNLTSVIYPGGEQVHNAYDLRNRLTSVKNKNGATIASFIYRANRQISEMLLGTMIRAMFSYNPRERLEAIEYKRRDNHEPIEGFRYKYDHTGRMIHEIQLDKGEAYGERYYYDDANRATKAEYGVQDVFDLNSSFEQQTSYEHFPERSWKRRTDVDGQGNIIGKRIGTINELSNYERFGEIAFAYDLNGNCIRKGTPNPGHCDYIYDQYNRLIKATCYDAAGNTSETREYFYDCCDRQVRKVVTDQNGKVTEYTYVWMGNKLLEEYENGVLVRTYCYGNGLVPIQLSVNKHGYYYTRNGKGLASGLVPKTDPNAFAEKYGYELTGFSFMKEIDGVKARPSAFSSVLNSILSGSYLRDWQNGTESLLGRHASPEIGAGLSGLGHDRTIDAFWKQEQEFSNMLGVGRSETGAEDTGYHPYPNDTETMATFGRYYSLIGAGDGGPFDFSAQPPRQERSNTLTKVRDSLVGFLTQAIVIVPGVLETTPGNLIGGAISGSVAGQTKSPAETAPAVENGAPGKPPSDPQPDPDPDPPVAPQPAGVDPDPDPDPTAMTNPDSDSGPANLRGGGLPVSSPINVEAQIMRTKRPVNPSDGVGAPPIVTSSPPSHIYPVGGDPSIALYDDSGGAVMVGGPINILPFIGGGFTDFLPGEAGPGGLSRSESGGRTVPNDGRP
jgi:YD repeat-containing protein